MSRTALLDRPIAFHRVFVTLAGSINAALMLSQCVYWQHRTTVPGEWWWKTEAEWTDETGMTRKEQATARETLKTLGVVQLDRRGVPAKLYYRLDIERLDAMLAALENAARSSCANPGIQLSEKEQQEVPKRDSKSSQKGSTITETTTETTADISTANAVEGAPAEEEPPPPARKPRSSKSSAADIDLPPWVPTDAWQAFVEMRKAQKKALTPYAAQLALEDLQRLREDGHDPKAVLDQSTLRCWQGLFAVKTDAPVPPTRGAKVNQLPTKYQPSGRL